MPAAMPRAEGEQAATAIGAPLGSAAPYDRGMVRLSHPTASDLTQVRRALTLCATGHTSLDSVAQQIVDLLFQELGGEDPDEPQVALARCFVTCPYSMLASRPDLKALASQLLGGSVPDPEHRCMVLLGTRGISDAWNQPRTSTGHQVIPLGSPELMQKTPMITELCRQIGIPREDFLTRGAVPMLDLAVRNAGFFHIPEALGSPFIPAQDGFVKPYGVRSVLGLGAPLSEHDFFTVLLFARVPISTETATALKPLTLSIKLALSVLRHRLFDLG